VSPKSHLKRLPEPTGAELDILRVLWQQGPRTVREVHEALRDQTGTGYTTVLKLLQIMHRKGLVKRDDSARAHIYAPVKNKEQTQKQYLGRFVHRVFEGSAAELIMQALGSGKPASSQDLKKIRDMLDDIEQGRK
jgi:predicted transcriptional regulator